MLKITEALSKHAGIIARFQLLMAKETENIALKPLEVEAGVKHIFDNPDIGKYYVALNDTDVIASILTLYEWSDWRNGSVIWIDSVYVLPEFRKKGVFKEMYSTTKRKVMEDKNLKGIRLYVDRANPDAISVYKHLGMDGGHYTLFEWMK